MEDSFKSEIEPRLMALPIRACIAFAARAARRVEPLYSNQPNVDPENIEKIAKAIALSESMARGGTIDSVVGGVVARAAAGAGREVAGAAALVGRVVAAAAGTAVIAAADLPDAATHAARAAANAARDADKADENESCRSALRNDLDLLSEWAATASDNSIPTAIFEEPLWPDGEPDWFKKDAAAEDGEKGAPPLADCS